MQVNTTNASLDPAIANAAVQNQIDTAVAVRARQVQQLQGEAAVEMIQSAVDISRQLASGHIDVKL
jgi:hypothetical protein